MAEMNDYLLLVSFFLGVILLDFRVCLVFKYLFDMIFGVVSSI
jgi:hypothetical protein